MGINFIDVTSGIGQAEGLNIEPVLNLVAGAEWGAPRPGSRAFRRYLVEVRVGMGDTPELKLVAGLTFWVYADSCGLKTAFLGNGGRNAATILSLRYSLSR